MSANKIMHEFEIWFAENYPKINREYTAQDCMFKMIAAQAWEQSRKAIEVTLPDRLPKDGRGDYWDGATNGYNQCIDACSISIKHAGIKVKS